MRKIKFRAWSKKLKKMYSNCDINDKGKITFAWNTQEKDNTKIKEYAGTKYENDCILMQYTGLTDKNGKEIYCSDIIKGYFEIDKIDDYVWLSLTEEERERGWKYFVLDEDIVEVARIPLPDELEVIGNVYENPMLLSNLKNNKIC